MRPRRSGSVGKMHVRFLRGLRPQAVVESPRVVARLTEENWTSRSTISVGRSRGVGRSPRSPSVERWPRRSARRAPRASSFASSLASIFSVSLQDTPATVAWASSTSRLKKHAGALSRGRVTALHVIRELTDHPHGLVKRLLDRPMSALVEARHGQVVRCLLGLRGVERQRGFIELSRGSARCRRPLRPLCWSSTTA